MNRDEPSKPLEVRAVVSYDEKVVTDAATQEKRSHTTQDSIKKATWAAFYGVTAYAVVTTFMWCSMMEQNRLTRVSIHQTETQWEAQNRPWVGLSGNVEFPKEPIFRVYSAASTRTEVDVDSLIKLKNVGISPSFDSVAKLTVLPTNNIATVQQLSPFEMSSTCGLADQENEGSVLFPGSEIAVEFDTLSGRPIELSKIERVWILGCIAYRGTSDGPKTRHHTKFWIMTYLLNTSQAKVEKRLAVLTMFTVPIRGWQIVKTEAD